MGQQHCRRRSKPNLTLIPSSTIYSNPRIQPLHLPQRTHDYYKRECNHKGLVTKTGLLRPSPISDHTGSYRRSSGPTRGHLRPLMASVTRGHEFEQALRVGDGQGSWVCCSPWGCKESDTTERLNWTEDLLSPLLTFFHFYNRSLPVALSAPQSHCREP